MRKYEHLYGSSLVILAALVMAGYSLATQRVFSFAPGALTGMITRAEHPQAWLGFTVFYAAFGVIFGWMRARVWWKVHHPDPR